MKNIEIKKRLKTHIQTKLNGKIKIIEKNDKVRIKSKRK